MTPIYTAICQHARQTPKQVAIQTIADHNTTSLTYGQLQRTLSALHQTLKTWQGKRVALYAHNDIDWIILDLALSTVSAVVVPIPLFFSAAQIAHLLQDAQIEMVYVGAGLQLPTIDNTDNWIIADTPETKTIKSEQATHITGSFYQLAGTITDHTFTAQNSSTASDFCKVTYTSGSTGMPKGVCLGQETLMRIVESLSGSLADTLTDDATHAPKVSNATSNFSHLSVLPFATLLENVAGIYVSLYMGRTLVTGHIDQLGLLSNQAFDAKRLMTTVQTYDIASVILLPQMLKAICEHMADKGATKSSANAAVPSLKFMAVGGGKVSPSITTRRQCLKLACL
ncbi:hypothetical protein PKHYL_21530 [Psychrobacter sp. KH172YL61]|uniref:AMP-binding protein n=1 Tax=Psychrobacter sp. KH172YL61 TaxID=2517899 RepID=UPI0010B5F598|nr:class I adenylate-forming enzyme family protein [Psychrobacter sp. KH172YL61]BBI67962.1 hypothetical protein PKHYL_21530 [Psychrobacter sp. KH172YL61]